jgi:hypothetical protein
VIALIRKLLDISERTAAAATAPKSVRRKSEREQREQVAPDVRHVAAAISSAVVSLFVKATPKNIEINLLLPSNSRVDEFAAASLQSSATALFMLRIVLPVTLGLVAFDLAA